MFDDVQVDYAIDGVPPFSCQTKDLGCTLSRYRIDESGRLLRDERCRLDDVVANNTPGPWLFQSDVIAAVRVRPDDHTVIHLWIVDGRLRDLVVRRIEPGASG